MPYSIEHKQKSREKILNAAVDLFCRYGFDQVSVTRVMTQASMTHGAFYAHFSSKSTLYCEAIQHGAKHSLWSTEQENIKTIDFFKTLISSYLSLQHVNMAGAQCPLAFLVNDAAHRDTNVRQSYEKTFKVMVSSMSAKLVTLGLADGDSLALTILSSLVGTVSLARTLTDSNCQALLLSANKEMLFKLLLTHQETNDSDINT